MKRFIDVYIDIQDLTDSDFIESLVAFTEQAPEWAYLEKESKNYAAVAGEFSCSILKVGNQNQPAVAITKKKDRTYFIVNIVPKKSPEIGISEYNDFARSFAKDLRKYTKDHGLNIKIKTTKEGVDLKDIITGSRCRSAFEKYMALHPRSYHYLDIERLDIFTCCLSRYSRKSFDSEMLRGWLMEAKGWPEKDAEWCAKRIEIGLDVLSANKKLY